MPDVILGLHLIGLNHLQSVAMSAPNGSHKKSDGKSRRQAFLLHEWLDPALASARTDVRRLPQSNEVERTRDEDHWAVSDPSIDAFIGDRSGCGALLRCAIT